MKKILLFILIVLSARSGIAQVVNTEGFESGVFPPAGWTAVGSTSYWNTVTTDGTGGGVTVTPHSGSYEGYINSFNWDCQGCAQIIASPAFTRALIPAGVTDSVGFWMYRDNGYDTPPYPTNFGADSITVYINTEPDTAGAAFVGTVARAITIATPVTVTTNGWYHYSFAVPAGYNSSINYLLVKATTGYGDNMFIDDITWTSWPAACAGAPTAGTITGPSGICSGTSFNLALAGDSLASGLSYQWYSSVVGSTGFTAIAGATNGYYSIASQPDTTSYEFVVTCIASGIADTTPVFTVTENTYYACYCSSGLGGDPSEVQLDGVAITGTTLHNTTPNNTTLYQSFPGSDSTTATLEQGVPYNFAVTGGSAYGDNYRAAVWIDYDHSGTFTTTEYTSITTDGTPGTTSYGTITVPSTSDLGLTGLRVRINGQYDGVSGSNACTNEYDGEVQDYIVNIIPSVPCNGSPAPGTAYASASTVCSSGAFNLADTAATIGGGISIQWYLSDSGAGVWNPLYGGNASFVTGVTQSAATDYIYVVTCANSGISDTSNIVSVSMSPFYLCYCSPLVGNTLDNSTGGALIDSFAIVGTTLNNSTPSGAPLYTQYWPSTPATTATLTQGNAYTATIKANQGTTNQYNAEMWIDYDQSGSFDGDPEDITLGNDAAAGISTVSFIVPGTTPTGVTGLRVRVTPNYYTLGGGDACNDDYDGTTEDYVITIAAGTPCTGTPVAGTAIASTATICSSSSFNLSDTGFQSGLGIEFQWYSRDSGTTAYAPLYGGSATTITGVSQSATTDYIFVSKCDSTGLSDTSNVITVGMSPFYLCYCSPLTGTTLDYSTYASLIDSFAIAGTTLNNPTPSGAPLYTQYWPTTASTTANLSQGTTYNASIKVTSGTFNNYTAIMWLDIDHSGTFDDGEATIINLDGTTLSTSTATFGVPGTTDTGFTGLRVRVAPYDSYGPMGSGDACSEEYDGTVEDYVVNVILGIPCTGTPTGGTAFSVASICDGASFNLSDTGASNGLGIEYQWFSRASGTTAYAPLYGGTTSFVSGVTQVGPTDYVLVATCDSSGLSDTSNVITVASSPFYLCYCSPNTDVTLGNDPEYTMLDSVSVPGTTLNVYNSSSSVTYMAFPAVGDSTATFTQVSTYNMNINVTNESYGDNYNAGMWIDYNHDGTFTSDEFTSIVTDASNPSSVTAPFTIPLSSMTGLTGMRVRVVADYITLSGSSACDNDYESQSYDFVVTINPAPPCAGAPTGGAAVANLGIACPTSSVTLTDAAAETASGLLFQWQSATDSATWTDIAGATSDPYTFTGMTANTQYRMKVTCSFSGLVDSSSLVSLVAGPCVCIPSYEYYGEPYGVMNNFTVTDDATTLSDNMPLDIVTTGYVDRTALTPLQFTTGHSYSGAVNYFYGESDIDNQIWIDANNDGIFTPDEVVTGVFGNPDGDYSSTSPFTMTVPVDMPGGLHRMRVRSAELDYPVGVSVVMDPCAQNDAVNTYAEGAAADYMVNLTPAPACTGAPVAGTAVASTGAACSATSITLSATGTTIALGLTYQWQSSTDDFTWAAISGATTAAYTFSGMSVTNYYRLIVSCTASATNDTTSIVSIHSLPCACVPSYEYSYYGETDGVMTMFQTTGVGGTSIEDNIGTTSATVEGAYVDRTFDMVTYQQGGTYGDTINYVYGTSQTGNQIFIDYNDDGVFDTVTEKVSDVFPNETTDPSVDDYTSTVYGVTNISATATPGLHRMRVRNAEYDYDYIAPSTTMDPCNSSDAFGNSYFTGITADYLVFISPTYCDSIVGITATGTTSTTELVSWTAIAGSAGYQYTVSSSATPPTGAGTSTSATTVELTDLIPGSTYYLFVRNSCGAGEYSVWESIVFTSNCDTVAGLTASPVTATAATISWTPVAGTTVYDYQIDLSPSAPTGAGGTTTTTTHDTTGLIPGTTYYAHVRNICAGGGASTWITIPFTTFCDTISGLTVSGVTDTSATLAWTAVSGSSDYQYIITTSATAPAVAGTTTSSVTASVTTLIPGTSYYAYVRNQCAGGGYSTWVSVPFTTGFCDSIVGSAVVVSSDDTGVVFSFTGVSGSLGYYYTVDTDPTAPGGGGIFTTNTTDTVTGLTPGNSYYIHIRSGCGAGYSSWANVPFVTGICDSVTGLTATTTDSGIIFTFTAASGVFGYSYVVDNSSAVPTGAGTFTTSNTDTVTGLTPGTIYYVHVRTSCGGGYSTWTELETGTTVPCDTTTAALLSYNNGTQTATIDWTYEAGAGYNYALNTTPGIPTTGITVAAAVDTNKVYPGLTANTTYYFHIQVICTTGLGASSSTWVTISFTTPPPVSVTNVNNTEFGVQAFPNPAINVVTVKVTGNAAANRVVELTDVTGKILKRVDMAASQVDVDMSDVAAGIYLIKYVDDDHTQVVKINKQ